MVDIRAFRGVLYPFGNDFKASDVLAPPYDVITKPERAAFAAKHPNNVVKLILPEIRDDDNETENQYTRAADLWREWRDERVLVQDNTPAIYCYDQTFAYNGNLVTRPGFVALIRVVNFSNGVVPHERTHSGPKEDRLRLIKACQANFSSIFSLYSDPNFVMEDTTA